MCKKNNKKQSHSGKRRVYRLFAAMVASSTSFALDSTYMIARGADSNDLSERFYDTTTGRTTSGMLYLKGEQALRDGLYLKAVKYCEQALQLNNDDPDLYVVYADALEQKLKHQVNKDPLVFRKCVQAWVTVLRNEVGEEKGMTARGIGSGLEGVYGDDERAVRAKKHLKALTGYIPKLWETNEHYLKRVLVPSESSVSAVVKP